MIMTTCPQCNQITLERSSRLGDVIETKFCHSCGFYERTRIVGWGKQSFEYGRQPITETQVGSTSPTEYLIRVMRDRHNIMLTQEQALKYDGMTENEILDDLFIPEFDWSDLKDDPPKGIIQKPLTQEESDAIEMDRR